ncbi:hypothetical protein ACROYT_G015333 [Oculina patagonica]
MKLAMAFVISRLLKINDEESWDESSIGMLHSSLEQRNVGKSLTMELLAKGKVPNRRHPSMLAGGNQCQTGASVYDTEWRYTPLKLTKIGNSATFESSKDKT